MSETIAASVAANKTETPTVVSDTSDTDNQAKSASINDTFSGVAIIQLLNRGGETTLISKTSRDSLHIMANSKAKVPQNYLSDTSNSGFVFLTYTGIVNGTKKTIEFKPGETIQALQIRISGGN